MKPVTTIINRALRKSGLPQRFIRGRGYYYVTGVAVSSSMYTCWLRASSQDLRHSVEHVNRVLAEEGVHAHLVLARDKAKVEHHPVAYTGYARRCYAFGNAPSSVQDWRESL